MHVRYGKPLRVAPGEEARAFGGRVAAALGTLLDEDRTDWYGARKRAAAGITPAPTGPDVARWRRVWESSAGPAPVRRRPRAWR